MAKVHDDINDELASWIAEQPVYFVASAPLSEAGHVNLSPRGLDSLRVMDGQRVVLLDFVGSGNETAAHLLENGRMTVMFCAFTGNPRILRLYGEGRAIVRGDKDWSEYRGLFDESLAGVRQLFELSVTRVQTSCGFGVPLMDLREPRGKLIEWAEKKGESALRQYQVDKNAQSIDGLPAPGCEIPGKK